MKVAHILKTKSLKSDGRVLKWLISLQEIGMSSEVFVLEDNNKAEKYFYHGSAVTTCSLAIRKLFPKKKGYLLKIPEFTFKSLKYLRRSDATIWIYHDVQHYLILLYLSVFKKYRKGKKIIWDLHELPHISLSKFYLTRKAIQFILSNVDLVVYTNKERRDCILKYFPYHEMKYVILNNYPVKEYITSQKAPPPLYLQEWLKGRSYILWMGEATERRNFLPFLKCLTKLEEDTKLVIMGIVAPEFQRFIHENGLSDRIFSIFVEQSAIIQFVDNALFSIVLYKHISENNIYCEPNRLYQLVARNVPVIVGNNPPMKSIVERYNAGIVLPDDGTNEEWLLAAIKELYRKISCGDVYARSGKKDENFNRLCWEHQFGEVGKAIASL